MLERGTIISSSPPQVLEEGFFTPKKKPGIKNWLKRNAGRLGANMVGAALGGALGHKIYKHRYGNLPKGATDHLMIGGTAALGASIGNMLYNKYKGYDTWKGYS